MIKERGCVFPWPEVGGGCHRICWQEIQQEIASVRKRMRCRVMDWSVVWTERGITLHVRLCNRNDDIITHTTDM